MKIQLKNSLLIAAIATAISPAHAVELDAGDWKLKFNGFVNAHLVYAQCEDNGATVAGNALLCTGDNATSVSNGYSPASFSLTAATNRANYDIAATLAIEPGTTDNAAFNGNKDGEAFRAFFTFGNASMGTIKVGRDYGVFGIDAIFADMTVGGTGAPAAIKSPINTSLGGAGYGYIFADRLSQITYYTPTNGVFSGAIGIFQPLDLVSFGGNGFVGDSGSKTPGIHGKIGLQLGKATSISSTFLQQDVNNAEGADYTASGVDLTAKTSFGGTTLVATAFKAEGLGYYGLLIDAADATGNPRDSDGWYIQATQSFGSTKIGINVGESSVDLAPSDTATQLKTEQKTTLGVYHTMSSGVTLVTEVSDITAENHAGAEINNKAFNIGFSLGF